MGKPKQSERRDRGGRARALGTAVLLALSLAPPPAARAWSGVAWGAITRDTIRTNADFMIDQTWSPKKSFSNFQVGTTYQPYQQGVTYKGVAYSQNNPQENWPEFLALVNNTAGGEVGYGNDCSGFASICWQLTGRNTTATFESRLGTYWTSLGAVGSAATTPLLSGDALNRASSHIILFYKYESGGLRSMEQTPDNAQRRLWSYSSLANYRPIRRAQINEAPQAPTLVTDGLSRVVDAGRPLALTIAATSLNGNPAYQWQRSGTNLPGATSSTLAFAAAQPALSGDYVCVVANAFGSVTSRVMSVTVAPPQTTVFFDPLDADTSANWTLNQSSADTRVTFHYDYTTLGIPAAPHSSGGAARGLKLEANLASGAAAAVSLSPKNQAFSGDHRLRFDFWINANGPFPEGGAGSTEHLAAGLGTSGNRVQWAAAGSAAEGCWFAVDGEGGASDTSATSGDFCAFLGPVLQNPAGGCYVAGIDANAKGNGHAYYTGAFPGGTTPPVAQRNAHAQQTGALAPGTVGFGWREAIIARRGDTVDWSIDGILLARMTNVSFAGGNVFVGYWDAFASISDNPSLSFALVANVRVEVPAGPPVVLNSFGFRDGCFEFGGDAAPGRYSIEASPDLAHWIEVTNFIHRGAGLLHRYPAASASRQYFRARLLP